MQWEWRGVVGVILASGVAIAIIALSVGIVVSERAISTEEATLLSTTLGAAIGAAATYLGGHRSNDGPKEPPS